MFTGIVEEMGRVHSLGLGRLAVEAQIVLEGTRIGDSIAVEGVCLTVVERGSGWFSVGIMPETLRRSTLGSLKPGQPVNLERALSLGGRLGGHLVQGHIDGTGTVAGRQPEGRAILVSVAAPSHIMRYVVEKGFIAVDGASLTVASCDAASFTVSLVPFTQANITLAGKRPGDLVNLEVDILAKYVERLAGRGKPAGGPGNEEQEGGLSMDFLAEHGFII